MPDSVWQLSYPTTANFKAFLMQINAAFTKRRLSIPTDLSANWKRQIDSSLYERLLLSNGDANKEKVLSLAQKGIEINQPADIIRDPYVFEFWVCRKTSPCWKATWEKGLW